MSPHPGKEAFLLAAGGGSVPPLYLEIPYSDPASIYESLCPGAYSIFLESVKGPPKIARYSFIAFDPYLMVTAKNGELRVSAFLDKRLDRSSVSYRPPLDRLRELIDAYPQAHEPSLPPFQGGASGMLSYDFVRYIEDIPNAASDDLGIPDVHFLMIDRLISFDHQEGRAWIVTCPGARDMELGYRDFSQVDWSRAYDEAAAAIADTASRIKDPGVRRGGMDLSGLSPEVRYETSKDRYKEIVLRAKEYIAAGDIFQANLSQRISASVGGRDPWDMYRALRAINPSPFASYADFGDYQLVSSSPERLVRVTGRTVDTRPIAGTRPRGADVGEDERMRADLLLNEKERAEHIMLIDLERNDLGRVCGYGSVKVDELMITEDYSHVIHIVSNVAGDLREGMSSFDVIRATFPGGTITGVPKVRCMEIIDELEPTARGPYTGSLGYLCFYGDMDLNIIIRTFVVKDGIAYVQAGAGIVADSDPEREYYETMKKAEALLKTLGA